MATIRKPATKPAARKPATASSKAASGNRPMKQPAARASTSTARRK